MPDHPDQHYHRQGIFRVDPREAQALSALPTHPTEGTEFFYRNVVRTLKGVMWAQGMRIVVEGAENFPQTGGALIACNHTGYYDFIFAGIAAELRGHRLVRFMSKKEIFDVPVVGTMMRAMKHIPVDRSAGRGAFDEAVRRLDQGQLVGIFPEATISRSFELKEFKNGAVRIADSAGVPLIPMAIWGSQRVWTKDHPRNLGRSNTPIVIVVGTPVDPAGEPDEATERLRDAMAELLTRAQSIYERDFGPIEKGQYWMPARLGGTAPTLERAQEIEQEEKARRQAKKK